MICNLLVLFGYLDLKGVFLVCKVVMYYMQEKGVVGVGFDDIYIGNGVFELIVMVIQVFLNDGDEVLLFVFDYLLWMVVVSLLGGMLVYYVCDEQNVWMFDFDDICCKIMLNMKVIVVINLNNLIGVFYFDELLLELFEIVCQYGLIVFVDEVYDKIVYDGFEYMVFGVLLEDVIIVMFNSLLKSYCLCGYCVGWMVVLGFGGDNCWCVKDYFEGFGILLLMCLCVNVFGQFVIQMVFGGYQSINELIVLSGCLYKQCEFVYDMLMLILGVICVKLQVVLYMFLCFDLKFYLIQNDQQFIFDLLFEECVLFVQGMGFNWMMFDYFCVVFLLNFDDLIDLINWIVCFFDGYCKCYLV